MGQDAKTHTIIIKVSYIEKCKIHGAAAANGRTVSGYMRHCSLKIMEMDGYNMDAITIESAPSKYEPRSTKPKHRETREEFCARTEVSMENFGNK